MVDLTIHAVQWCAHHGHPVLALRIGQSDRFFVVAITPADAQALAAANGSMSMHGSERERLLVLLETTVAALRARLTSVCLHVGGDAVLRAALHLDGPDGAVALPAHFADGVALAQRRRLPLRISEVDLARVPVDAIERYAPASPPTPSAGGAVPLPTTTPAPFRALIDSLDLDGFAGPAPGEAP